MTSDNLPTSGPELGILQSTVAWAPLTALIVAWESELKTLPLSLLAANVVNIIYPLFAAPVLPFWRGCILNVELNGSQEITLPLAVWVPWALWDMIISFTANEPEPRTFVSVKSTKSGNVTTPVGKDAGL